MSKLRDYIAQKLAEQNEDPVYGYYDHAKEKLKPVARSVEIQKRYGLNETDVEEESGFMDSPSRDYVKKFYGVDPREKVQYNRQRKIKAADASLYFKDRGIDDMIKQNKEPRASTMRNKIHGKTLEEAARVMIVKARIRAGKVQRRKKVSNVAGYTLRGGKMTRMSVTERRNRRMGQRRGKIKRRVKMTRTLMKRARSLRRREALGI